MQLKNKNPIGAAIEDFRNSSRDMSVQEEISLTG
jgi:hypothetical protein